MFNSKEILTIKNLGLRDFILASILRVMCPEYYIATTISDFKNDKGNIAPTKRIIPTSDGHLYFGRAVIQFPAVDYKDLEEDMGAISDLTSSLEVSLIFLNRNLKEDLEARPRLILPKMLYDPKEELSFLLDYGREIPEEEVQDERFSAVPHRGRLGLAGSY
ncbi:MAG TPA: hypothetical protein HA282_05140 [Nanoarchaeota archaeon]|nr:hypothetical protein [Candidatus Pacearchaeota archaeon]HIH17212.1 hypothetical protein [Nanoarchaeota archaeon]HIH34558.1 hypothetical protein [Nanoarchaeota archaeon]HIH51868.1 hypothetical protein [Nanoarchaeota archaeon]HIH66567.1 hypothetical protein [Nanoarchaeota archaeon]